MAAITLVFILGPGANRAFPAASIHLVSKDFENPAPGSDVVVAVNVKPADGATSMDFTFGYDTAALTPAAVYKTAFTHGFTLSSSLATPGVVDAHLSGGAALSGNGDVLWIVFRVLGSGGTSTSLTWSSTILNGGAIESQPHDGTVSIVSAQTIISCPDTAQAAPSSQVAVPISASTLNYCIGGSNNHGTCTSDANCPGGGTCGTTGIDLVVAFDQNVISAVSVQKTAITQSLTLSSNVSTPGEVRIVLFGTGAVRGAGALVTITFNVVGAFGSATPLNVTRGSLNEGAISTSLDDGLFIVCDNTDPDQDGFSACAGDCDNADSSRHPGATELCNGIDEDCDGTVDEGATCTDNNACTTSDTCSGGACVGGSPLSCNDGNPCTDDSCSPATGCVHEDNTASCSDGNACTTNDACSGGVCVGGQATSCDDADVCTDDSCQPASGCVHTFNTAPCSDGDACTTGDACSGGVCVGGPAPSCDDADVCTNDSCQPASGCVHTFNTAPCSDGDACTANDVCSGGACIGGPAPSCDDANLCTDDSCQPASGCVHDANQAACDDGNSCTSGDACSAGACTGMPPANPAEVNDSLVLHSMGSTAVVSWTDTPGPFNVYRGTFAVSSPWTYEQSCFWGNSATTSVEDVENPPAGGGFFYLVTRTTECGESIPGRDSSQNAIPNPSPCAP